MLRLPFKYEMPANTSNALEAPEMQALIARYFNQSAEGILLFGETGLIDCNQSVLQMMRCDDTLTLRTLHPSEMSPEFQPDGRRSDEKCLEIDHIVNQKGIHTFEWLHRRLDGSHLPVRVTMCRDQVYGQSILLVGWQDLTTQKKLQHDFEQLSRSFARAESLARVGHWRYELGSKDINWSDEVFRIHGYQPDEIVPTIEMSINAYHPEDRALVKKSLEEIRFNKAGFNFQLRLVQPDQSIRHVICQGEPEIDERGQVYAIFGIYHDVTDVVNAQKALDESENKFKDVLDSSGEYIWEMDLSGNFISVGEKAIEGFGYKTEDIVGHNIFEFMPQDAAKKAKTFFDNKIRQQQAFRDYEIQCFNAHGEVTWHRYSGKPVFNDQGNLILYRGAGLDITERKKIETQLLENKERLDYALTASNEGLFDWNLDTDEVYYSPAYYRILGYEDKELPYQFSSWLDKIHAEDKEKVKADLRQHIEGKSIFFINQHRIQSKQKDYIWIEARGQVIRDENNVPRRFIGAFSSIQDKKEKEAELKTARDRAGAANVSKGEFLSNMSHEIRTPMNGIMGMTELLAQSNLSVEQRGYCDILKNSAESLLGLVNDILDLAKVESGQIELDAISFDIYRIVDEVIRLFRPRADSKGIDLRFIPPTDYVPNIVIGDPARLKQILTNLVGNALKFTEVGSVIVRVELLWQTKGAFNQYQFIVQDSGIGIADNKIDAIFEEFSQADNSSTRKYGGTGLGLAICKRIVDLMNGKISVTSSLNRGSTFAVQLPFRSTEAPVKDGNSQPAKNISSLRSDYKDDTTVTRPISILLAEDIPTNQIVAKAFFERLGYKIEVVNNGLEAVEAVKHKEYHIIFMDLQMPEMDGEEATKAILNMYDGNPMRPKIVAMTAHAMTGDREKCLNLGMDDYISKPINLDALRDILVRIISKL